MTIFLLSSLDTSSTAVSVEGALPPRTHCFTPPLITATGTHTKYSPGGGVVRSVQLVALTPRPLFGSSQLVSIYAHTAVSLCRVLGSESHIYMWCGSGVPLAV